MKKLVYFIVALDIAALFFFCTTAASAVAIFQPIQGGTGSSTLSGILIGNGKSPLNTLTIGTNLTLTGTTLNATGGSASSTLLSDNNTFSGINKFTSTTTNANGDIFSQQATFIVATSSKVGQFTNLQSALNALPAAGGKIHVRCGTYTLSASTTIAGSHIVIEGEGDCTQFNFDGTSVNPAFNTSDGTQRTDNVFKDFLINQTSAGGAGTAINGSHFARSTFDHVNITGANIGMDFGNVHALYNRIQDPLISVQGVGSIGIRFTSTANDNQVYSPRIVTDANSTGIYFDAHSNTCYSCDVETGALIGIDITANANNTTLINPYLESNITNLRVASGVHSITMIGGYIASASTANITDNGALGFSVLGTRVQFLPYSYINGIDVGINTLNQQFRLEVGTTTAQNVARINGVSSANGAPVLSLFRRGSAEWVLAGGGGASSNFSIGANPSGGGLTDTDTNILNAAKLVLTTAGNMGLGTTTPWGKFALNLNSADTNQYAFLIASSTATATTTLFSVDNTGAASTTFLFGAGLATCNAAGKALTWTGGLFTCGTISAGAASSTLLSDNNTWSGTNAFGAITVSSCTGCGSGSGAWPWTIATNYGTTTNATTTPTWFKTGLMASSTSYFEIPDATLGWIRSSGRTLAYATSSYTVFGFNAGGNSATTTNGNNRNAAFGDSALSANTGTDNSAFGSTALSANSSGTGNTAVGSGAGSTITTGTSNTAIGNGTLHSGGNVTQNTAIGAGALNISNGINNTALGYNALTLNTTAISNTAVGDRALSNTVLGSRNTALGDIAGITNASGVGNTLLGYAANVSSNNLSTSTAIGAGSTVDCSNCLTLGGTGVNAVNVGIASSSPFAPLSVVGNIQQYGTYAHFCGAAPLVALVTGMECWGDDNTTNGNGFTVGNRNGGSSAFSYVTLANDLTNASVTSYAGLILNSHHYSDTTFGTLFATPDLLALQNTDGPITFITSTSTTAANYISFATGITPADERMRLTAAGNFGIGTTSPTSRLGVAGNSFFGGNVTATGTLKLTPLATPAGSILATDPSGNIIATTTSAGGVTAVTGVYPVQSTGGGTPAISLAFGTTTSNTFAGTQTFNNVTVNGTCTGCGTGVWPFTADSYAGIANQSTTTPFWLKNTQLIASTTFANFATTTDKLYVGPANIAFGTNGPLGSGGFGNTVLACNGCGAIGDNLLDIANFGAGVPGINTFSARGTAAIPTATQSGDVLYFMGGRGFGSTVWDNGSKAVIQMVAAQTHTDTANGTYITLETTPLNSTTRAERVRVDPSGNVGIGTSTPGSLLSLNSLANFTTATSSFYSTGGINLTGGGCFAVNGTCITGTGGAGTVTQVNTTYPVLGGPITNSGTLSLAFGTTTANTWSGLQTFTNAGTTTFSGGLDFTRFNLSATSTGSQGINLSGGCFAVNGTCVGGSSSGAWPWTSATNFGTTTNATTTGSWFQQGLYASSTSQLVNANVWGNLVMQPTGSILSVGSTTPWLANSFTLGSTTPIIEEVYTPATSTAMTISMATGTVQQIDTGTSAYQITVSGYQIANGQSKTLINCNPGSAAGNTLTWVAGAGVHLSFPNNITPSNTTQAGTCELYQMGPVFTPFASTTPWVPIIQLTGLQ